MCTLVGFSNNIVTVQKTTKNNKKSDVLSSVKKFYAKPSVKTTLKIVAGIAGLCTGAWILKYMLSPEQLPAQEKNEFIINNDPNFFTQKNTNEGALLHLFARNGRLNTIDQVLQAHPMVNFKVRTANGEHIVDLAPENRKQKLINLLKEHLLRIHNANPKDDQLECAVCFNNAIECDDCQDINNPLKRIHLLPCCLGCFANIILQLSPILTKRPKVRAQYAHIVESL